MSIAFLYGESANWILNSATREIMDSRHVDIHIHSATTFDRCQQYKTNMLRHAQAYCHKSDGDFDSDKGQYYTWGK